MPLSEARKYLGSFLFTGDDVFKPISTLSGGERGRVALAKLALSGANLLILDEPTNHLDIPSQEILEAVLADFDGTILLVSHDRYLIHNLATQIWVLDTPRSSDQSRMAVYEGTYKEYVAWRDKQLSGEGSRSQAHRRTKSGSPDRSAESGMTKYQREKRLAQVEDQIHALETELEQVTQQLESASAAGHVDQVAELGGRYSTIETTLEQLMEEWETLLAEG
jgi:ATP-binding cassette subfamily F protein 3